MYTVFASSQTMEGTNGIYIQFCSDLLLFYIGVVKVSFSYIFADL